MSQNKGEARVGQPCLPAELFVNTFAFPRRRLRPHEGSAAHAVMLEMNNRLRPVVRLHR